MCVKSILRMSERNHCANPSELGSGSARHGCHSGVVAIAFGTGTEVRRSIHQRTSVCTGIDGTDPQPGGRLIATMAPLQMLSALEDRSVLDKTGVAGEFDVSLPAFSRLAQTAGTIADGVPVDVTAPSLSTLLQEIGLRLEPQKQLMDVYVIDNVEKPTVNRASLRQTR
jgi:hypothetical protein